MFADQTTSSDPRQNTPANKAAKRGDLSRKAVTSIIWKQQMCWWLDQGPFAGVNLDGVVRQLHSEGASNQRIVFTSTCSCFCNTTTIAVSSLSGARLYFATPRS